MSASTSGPEVERRFVLGAAAITVATALIRLLPDPDKGGNLQSDFTLGGLAMVVCWGLLAVVAEPRRRAMVRGVAGGVVLGLVMLIAVVAVLTGIWIALLPFG
jgi:hypothetical protein